jgi:ribonuclease HI
MNAYTDGACRLSNPGETSCAFAVDLNGKWYTHARYLGPALHTNNYAEYLGLLELLTWAEKEHILGLDIYCDSKLVVDQVCGRMAVLSRDLEPFVNTAIFYKTRGGHKLHHIRGHQGNEGNELVDRLCNEVLDEEFARRKTETDAAADYFECTGESYWKQCPTDQRKIIEAWKEDQ